MHHEHRPPIRRRRGEDHTDDPIGPGRHTAHDPAAEGVLDERGVETRGADPKRGDAQVGEQRARVARVGRGNRENACRHVHRNRRRYLQPARAKKGSGWDRSAATHPALPPGPAWAALSASESTPRSFPSDAAFRNRLELARTYTLVSMPTAAQPPTTHVFDGYRLVRVASSIAWSDPAEVFTRTFWS